jgi:hypothetical protein
MSSKFIVNIIRAFVERLQEKENITLMSLDLTVLSSSSILEEVNVIAVELDANCYRSGSRPTPPTNRAETKVLISWLLPGSRLPAVRVL